MQVKVEPVGTLDDDPKEDATEHYGRSIQSGDAESDFMEYYDDSGSDTKEEVSKIKNEPGTGIQCDICLQLLLTVQKLVAHRHIHTMDLTYTCLICYKTYTDKTHLHTHIKYIHACAIFSINRNTVGIEEKPSAIKDDPGTGVQCDICQLLLPTAQKLVVHRRIHTLDLTYTCLMCFGIFPNREQLRTHMKCMHACSTSSVRNKTFKRDVSQIEFKRKDKLEVHIRTHTDKRLYECRVVLFKMHFDQNPDEPNERIPSKEQQLKKSHEYHLCHVVYSRKDNLTRHMRKKHTDRRPDVCDTRLPRQSGNQYHEQILVKEELERKLHECHFCHMGYSWKCGLMRHIRKKHPDRKSYECAICHKLFKSKITLRKHISECLEEPYECLICSKLFEQKRSLEEHILTNSGKKQHESVNETVERFSYQKRINKHTFRTEQFIKSHECTTCNKQFRFNWALVDHVRTHTGEKPHECDVCHRKFADRRNLREHEGIHNSDRHQCNICQKLLTSKRILRKHMLIHSDSTEKLYECDICHKFFKKSYITAHKRIHTERNSFECKICNIIYNNKNTLARHLRNHIEQECYECLICNKVYKRKEYLKEHLRSHSSEKPYECDVCHKRFTRSGLLRIHKFVHTEDKLHECDICGMRFKFNANLTQHKRRHNGEKPYECDVCHKKFTANNGLKAHKRMHSDEKLFTCNICKKRFVQPTGLITHMRIHSEEKMYKCVICYKEFNFKHNLTVHLRTHTGEKPYECNVCKSRFASSGSLCVHRRIHNIVPKSKELSKHKITH